MRPWLGVVGFAIGSITTMISTRQHYVEGDDSMRLLVAAGFVVVVALTFVGRRQT